MRQGICDLILGPALPGRGRTSHCSGGSSERRRYLPQKMRRSYELSYEPPLRRYGSCAVSGFQRRMQTAKAVAAFDQRILTPLEAGC